MKKLIGIILTLVTLVVLFNAAGNAVKSEIENATAKGTATASYMKAGQ